MAFAEPLAVFFAGEFSGVATYNGAADITGIFDNPSRDALGITGSGPRFTCKASDIPAPEEGQTIILASGGDYSITDWSYDTTQTVITLELQVYEGGLFEDVSPLWVNEIRARASGAQEDLDGWWTLGGGDDIDDLLSVTATVTTDTGAAVWAPDPDTWGSLVAHGSGSDTLTLSGPWRDLKALFKFTVDAAHGALYVDYGTPLSDTAVSITLQFSHLSEVSTDVGTLDTEVLSAAHSLYALTVTGTHTLPALTVGAPHSINDGVFLLAAVAHADANSKLKLVLSTPHGVIVYAAGSETLEGSGGSGTNLFTAHGTAANIIALLNGSSSAHLTLTAPSSGADDLTYGIYLYVDPVGVDVPIDFSSLVVPFTAS